MSHILQFTTGADEEPPLGFTLPPSIAFTEATALFYPRANTCTSCLTLPTLSAAVPLPDENEIFLSFDAAFGHSYFGGK